MAVRFPPGRASPSACEDRLSERHSGGCACGAVRYEVTGPLRPVVACHCESCRRQSGHYYACSAAPADALHIEGEENLAEWRASDAARRRFCRVCGSTMFWERDGAPTVSFLAGTLDSPTGLALSHHIYVAEKGDYYELTDGLPAYPVRKEE